MTRSQRNLAITAACMVVVAAAVWMYRFVHDRRIAANEKSLTATLDLRFTAPIGYEFCAGKSPPPHLPHKNLSLRISLPASISDLPPDAGVHEIVFRPGTHDVDVYKHLDSGRLIATRGEIHLEGSHPVLNVKLDMGDWPPGRYVVGISGDPFFGYCTMEFSGE